MINTECVQSGTGLRNVKNAHTYLFLYFTLLFIHILFNFKQLTIEIWKIRAAKLQLTPVNCCDIPVNPNKLDNSLANN